MAEPRTFDHREFSRSRLAAERNASVSVCLPSRDEEATIGEVLDAIMPLARAGVVDQVVVVDDSTDATAEIARGRGAEVYRQSDLRTEFGPVLGKGDAMWRALSVLASEVVCFVDADSRDFADHFVLGLIGPLVTEVEGAAPSLVKGFYRRPFDNGDGAPQADGGGRVTELCARPLLAAFYPELAAIRQPLAGEVAARRDLLESLPFTTGYGVDIGLLIDAWERVGIERIAQVDLDRRQNRHRPLQELGPMATAVTASLLERVQRDGRLANASPSPTPLVGATHRPPAASLRRPVAA